MPIIDSTGFQAPFPKEARVPPPGEMVITTETLERLKVPDEVLLRPETVNPFMAGQWVKLADIIARPEIRSLTAEFSPPPSPDDPPLVAAQSLLSREEAEAFGSWGEEKMVAAQSGDLDRLGDEIEKYISEMKKDHPEMEKSSKGSGVISDPFTDMIFAKEMMESEEERREWKDKLAAAASSGNPELFLATMGERASRRMMKLVGRLVERQAFLIEQRDGVMKDLGLDKNPSTAEIAKGNMEFASFQGDVSNNVMQIQYALNEYQRITEWTAKTGTETTKPLQLMIQNMKT